MTQSMKKLIGTIAILLFVIAYALVVMALAQPVLRDANGFTQFLFYLLAGVSWVVPILPLIKWMESR